MNKLFYVRKANKNTLSKTEISTLKRVLAKLNHPVEKTLQELLSVHRGDPIALVAWEGASSGIKYSVVTKYAKDKQNRDRQKVIAYERLNKKARYIATEATSNVDILKLILTDIVNSDFPQRTRKAAKEMLENRYSF
jgi:hypothetical protein